MGDEERAPSSAELAEMSDLLRRALEQGAVGFSTGLIYRPGRVATREEIIEVARPLADFLGLVVATAWRAQRRRPLASNRSKRRGEHRGSRRLPCADLSSQVWRSAQLGQGQSFAGSRRRCQRCRRRRDARRLPVRRRQRPDDRILRSDQDRFGLGRGDPNSFLPRLPRLRGPSADGDRQHRRRRARRARSKNNSAGCPGQNAPWPSPSSWQKRTWRRTCGTLVS